MDKRTILLIILVCIVMLDLASIVIQIDEDRERQVTGRMDMYCKSINMTYSSHDDYAFICVSKIGMKSIPYKNNRTLRLMR